MMKTTVETDWKAAVQAGIIAGAVFMMLEMLLVALVKGGSPWGPPRLIAAILLGKEVLPPPATFALGMFLAALVVHFALSIVFGIALAFVVKSLDMGIAIAIGFAFGLILYFVNFYGFTALFPWFATARNPVTIFTHLVFGAVVALVYKRMQTPAMVSA